MSECRAILPRCWGFQGQLTLLFSVAVLCFALLGALVTSWMGGKRDLRNILDQGTQITSSFARQSVLALLYGLGENARNGAETTLGFPGVSNVSVYAKTGDVLLHQGADTDWNPALKGKLPSSPAFLAHETKDAWHFLAPVYTHYSEEDNTSPFDLRTEDSEYLGFVHVTLDKSGFKAMQRERFTTNFLSTFFFAVIMLALLRWLTSRLTRPLNALAELMKRAENGEPAVRAVPRGPKEVLNMSRAFNTMMSVLEERAGRLDQQNGMLLREIKEREQAERQLIEFRDHLQEMVDEQTRDLIDTRDAALVAERAMSAFLANMSHELRTPLHGILSYSAFGLSKLHTASKEKLQQYFSEIQDSGQRLLTLLNDLLDLSKLRAGKMTYNYAEADLEEITHLVMSEFASLAEEKNITVATNSAGNPRAVTMDEDRIAQVLRNLLSNAIKFSAEGSRVEVSVEFRDEGAAQVSVADQGVGVPPEELEFIFDAFTQSSMTRTDAGGTGLGLPICKEIIEGGHKGWIKAANRQTGGSRFTFSIPSVRPT